MSSNIDAIYCVSLERLVDRRKKAIGLVSQLSFCPIYFLNAIDGSDYDWEDFYEEKIYEYKNWGLPDNKCNIEFENGRKIYLKYWNRPITKGEMGCSLSHLYIWKHSVQNNFETILVLEDDIDFSIQELEMGLNVYLDFTKNNEYDIFYLGGNSLKNGESINENVIRTLFMYCTQAYIATSSAINVLLESNFQSNIIAVDEFLSSFFMPHPREDVRNLYHQKRLLSAFHLKNHVIIQNDLGGSQTELIGNNVS